MSGGEGEVELAFVKVQKRPSRSYMATIPAEAVKQLGIKDKQRLKVYLDKNTKRVIFEVLEW